MISLYSPSKINLFLRIINKRLDGFHNLASLFQTINLCDLLTISFAEKDQMICTDVRIPCDQSNLVWKAIDLFRRKTGITSSFSVLIDKKIPIEAGLGGGSGNAATTLWALNQLCNACAKEEDLAQWGSEIGSDVAFFFSRGTAYCTGRGEILSNQPALPYQDAWIVKPALGLSTKDVYANLRLTEQPQRDPEQFLQLSYAGPQHLFNDMEHAAFSLCPTLQDLKESLSNNGFEVVRMSGSGTSFFCIGNGVLPTDGNLFIKKVTFIQRPKDAWYLQ